MARQQKQKAAEPQIPEGIPPGHELTLAETAIDEKLKQIQEGYTEERDLVNQILGQAQAAGAINKISRTIGISKLAYVKENKLYRALKGSISPNGSEFSGTWEDFCSLLDMSVDKADDDIKNLHAFGEEALDSMSRIGIGYRDLRQFRRLPADQKTELIEAAKSGDKDTLLELAEDLIAKHGKEKESLAKDNADLKADYEAQEKIIQDKNKKIDAQEKLLHKLQNRSGEWAPRAKEICIETTRVAADALEALDKLDVMRDAILNEDFGEDERESAIEAMAVVYYDAVEQITGRLAEVAAACDEVFIGYKEKARPMLQVFGEKQG